MQPGCHCHKCVSLLLRSGRNNTISSLHLTGTVSAVPPSLQVQNTAAALPVEGSGPAVTSSTYTYLQVQCPTASQEKASRTELARAQGG